MQGTATIESLAHGGHGICHFRDKICFVPGALPGDKVALRVDRVQRGIQWAALLAIVEPSPHRIEMDTPLHGGNSWLPFAYPAQAEWKQRIVADCLSRMGGVEVEIGFQEEPELRTAYRTRATVHCDGTYVGFFARSSHEILHESPCPLLHPKLSNAIDQLRAHPPKAAVDLTVNPDGDDVLAWTKESAPRVAKVFASYNYLKDSSPRHAFELDGIPIVNGCFSQASLLLNRRLQDHVRKHIGGATSVLDLYSGSGNLSLTLPESVEVLGVDHARAAIEAAANRRETYRVGDESAMAEAISERPWDIAIIDPPRQGAKALTGPINESSLTKLLYVACDPAALARDVKALTAGRWHLDECTIIDLFPHTPHMETVCLLTR